MTFRPKIQPLVPTENDYTHQLIVDEDNPNQYVLFWKMINEDEIQFEAHCKSIGWIGKKSLIILNILIYLHVSGFGISSNGGMDGADLAIGWVKNGVAVLKVRLFLQFFKQ